MFRMILYMAHYHHYGWQQRCRPFWQPSPMFNLLKDTFTSSKVGEPFIDSMKWSLLKVVKCRLVRMISPVELTRKVFLSSFPYFRYAIIDVGVIFFYLKVLTWVKALLNGILCLKSNWTCCAVWHKGESWISGSCYHLAGYLGNI